MQRSLPPVPLASTPDPGPEQARRPADEVALTRQAARLQRQPQVPWLHQEAARRLAEHLGVIRQPPALVLDWWAHRGGSAAALHQALPAAQIIRVEDGPVGAGPALGLGGWFKRLRPQPRVRLPEEVPAGSAHLLWANMGLHFVHDIPGQLARWRRCIADQGFLMFSTLGPGTLPQLRALYARQGWGAPAAAEVDMHDLGDMLVQQGYAEPVMHQELLTLTYANATAALAELRTLGGNAHPGRFAACRGRRWRRTLLEALDSQAGPDGRIALSFELVYGHAFCPPQRPRVSQRSEVSLEAMRAMLRGPRLGKDPSRPG
jgi:malonyl-CoA O-methyltransferase